MQRMKKVLRSFWSQVSFARSSNWQEQEEAGVSHPSRRVRWGRGSVIVAGSCLVLAVTASVIHFRRQEVQEAKQYVEQFELSQILKPNSQALRVISQIAQRAPFSDKNLQLFRVNAKDEYRIARLFSEEVRQQILLPALQKSFTQAEGRLKSLYLMALIYSSHDNELGQTIKKNLGEWTDELGLPASLISSYVDLNESAWGRALTVEDLAAMEVVPQSKELENWSHFFSDINGVVEKPLLAAPTLEAIQETARRLVQEQSPIQSGRGAEIYALLHQVPQSNVDGLFPTEKRFIEWKNRYEPEVSHFLSVIEQTRLDVHPVADMHLGDLLRELQAMADTRAKAAESFRVGFSGENTPFEVKRWNELVSNSQAHFLVEDFLNMKEGASSDLLVSRNVEFPALLWNGECADCGLIQSDASIAGPYTQKALDEEIGPTLVGFDQLLRSDLLPLIERERLAGFVADCAEHYAAEYRQQHQQFIGSFTAGVDSPSRLKVFLMQMQLDNSPLRSFLQTLSREGHIQIPRNRFSEGILREAGEFAFADRLLNQDEKGLARLEGYEAILQGIEKRLYREKVQDEDGPLVSSLSPIARIVYGIMKEEANSPWQATVAWLESSGVPEEFRKPFLEPLNRVIQLGLKETVAVLEERWKKDMVPELAAIASKFPFDPASAEEVTPQEMERVLKPKSRFWLSFERYFEPFLDRKEGYWDVSQVKNNPLPLAPEYLCTFSRLKGLQEALWDAKGQPKPMTLAIKPVPMDSTGDSENEVVLGFINNGGGSVYSFNQAPAWQELALEWWKEEGAAVGITVVNRDNKQKSYQRLAMPESRWSLLKLLQKAETDENGVLTWKVPTQGPDEEETVQRIPFELKQAPLELFQVDCGQVFSR